MKKAVSNILSRQSLLLLVSAVTMSSLTGCGGGSGGPATITGTGRIVFSSFTDYDPTTSTNNFDIYSVRADGTRVQRLTRNPKPDTDPAYSLDGRKIAFFSRRNEASNEIRKSLYVMNANGTDQTFLADGGDRGGSPTWSPDGSRIVFVASRGGQTDIYSISPTAGDEKRLTNTPSDEYFPCYSPDGRRIIFAASANSSSPLSLFVMNSDGTNPIQITTDSGYSPDWSPDGSKIVFASARSGNNEIYIMNADGSDQTRLTFDPEPTTNNPNTVDMAPTFSPDGQQIAFLSTRGPGGANRRIHIMNRDGSNQRRLPNGDAIVVKDTISWAPDAL